MAEHLVTVLTNRSGTWGWCRTCAWQGPQYQGDGAQTQASADATAHAARMSEQPAAGAGRADETGEDQ